MILTILFLFESTKTHWLDSRGRLALPHILCEPVPSPLSFPVSNILLVSLSLPPLGSTQQKSEGGGTFDVVPFGIPGCRAGWGNKEMICGRKNGTIYHSDILMTTFFFFNFYLFIYFWLCWVFISVRGLSPVVARGGHSSSRCADLSLPRPLSLRSTGSRRAGSAIVAHGPSRSAARGILPDQGPNPRPLHWQGDSQPLRHQGSPLMTTLYPSQNLG